MEKNKLAIYALLALPLAFIGLPIYVHIANFYNKEFGLSLIIIGLVLTFSRVIDTFQDPLIGHFSDKLLKKNISRQKIIFYNSPFLALSFYFLFNPASGLGSFGLAAWLAAGLIATYTFFSIITINYNSLGAEIAEDYQQRNKVTSIREAVGLVGILTASILPAILAMSFKISQNSSFFYLTLFYAPPLIIFAALIWRFLPTPPSQEISISSPKIKLNRDFIWLGGIFLINSIAVSLPASTFLFFVEDILREEEKSGFFLMTYFLSGALGMPLWSYLVKIIGKKNSWIISIILSIIIFIWAYSLQAHQYQEFYIICLLSGIALGADLAIPPSMLADLIAKNSAPTGTYFGLWNMLSKLGLAIASGGSLLLLGLSGYRAEATTFFEPLQTLSLTYSLLPCAIKVIVIILLLISKIDKKPV